MKQEKIGAVNEIVVTKLNLSLEPNTPIFIAETNLQHIMDKHPEDFKKYGGEIAEILAQPDYIAVHPKNDSIQYMKVFYDEQTEERVLVAVRSTRKGIMYVRSLFVMSEAKVKSYEKRGALIKYKDET